MGAALIMLAVLSVSLMVVKMQGQGGHKHHSSTELGKPAIAVTV